MIVLYWLICIVFVSLFVYRIIIGEVNFGDDIYWICIWFAVELMIKSLC